MNRSSVRKRNGTKVPTARSFCLRPAEKTADLLAQFDAWKHVVEGIADEVWWCDAEGRMSLLNHPEVIHIGLEQFNNKSVGQLLEEIEIFLPNGELRPPEQAPLLRSLRGEIVRGEEIMCHRASGRTRWRQFSSAPIRNPTGEITGAVAIVWDITEHKQMDELVQQARDALETRVQERTAQLQATHDALAESEARYHGLFQAISDAILVIDVATLRIVDVNDAAVRLLGYTREEFLGRSIEELTTEPKETAAALAGVRAGTVHRVPLRYYKRKDSTLVPVEISGNVFSANGRQMVCGIFRDLTERRQLEDELLRISEREQQRIACDLHDGLGQQLVGIAFGMNALERSLAARRHSEAGNAREICDLLDCAITDARRLARGLQPVCQEPEGLMEALEQLARTAGGLFKCRCRFVCPKPVLVRDSRVANHLFRIAQEAVTNAHRHGQAQQMLITLRLQQGRLTLSVADNGKGLPKVPPAQAGMGLRIMKHRADLIGGTLQLEKAGKRGVRVLCSVDRF